MRQTALIVILAYMGSFVPAESAVIGDIDQIFTRIGASDDLASGRSTFMVEMTETATIAHYATNRSLVLMDEIGRGTSTFDGLAIAWATAEYLADLQALTLFSTHYFELTELPDQRSDVANVHFGAMEHNDTIVFLHEVKQGAASRSYGIQVAALAGLPRDLVERASEKLKMLEENSRRQAVLTQDTAMEQEENRTGEKTAQSPEAKQPRGAEERTQKENGGENRTEKKTGKDTGKELGEDDRLDHNVNEASEQAVTAGQREALARLAATSPDDLTPKAALALLYELTELAG